MSFRSVAMLSWRSILWGVFVFTCIRAVAQDEPDNERRAAQDRRGRIQKFVDDFMSREMDAMSIPGACIAVVEDQSVTAKGYGMADVASSTPVDPAHTSFRIASVGKTLTALAVLQVAHSGDLDLETPVARYLDSRFSIPNQVTSRSLLLHTAGFDERLIGYQTRQAADFPLLGEHLAARLPQIRPNPDQVPSYSNYGYGLAGYVVESVTGIALRDWVETEIFQSLGMDHSFYVVPPLDDRTQLLATEYHGSGRVQPLHFSNPYPAGGVASSAQDMGRFLQALMSSYAGERSNVIEPAVAQKMMTPQLQLIPKLEGLGFGLNQQLVAGRTVWLKGGAAPKHSAVIALLPAERSAVFIAVNRQEPRFWELFLGDFVREFHPGLNQIDQRESGEFAARPTGVYELTRTSQSTIERVAAPLLQVTVYDAGDRSIGVRSLSNDLPSGPFRHQANRIFRDQDHYAAFKNGERGRYLLMNVAGEHFAFRFVPWYATRTLHLWVACVAAAVIVSFPLVRCLRRVKHRIDGNPRRPADVHRHLSLVCHFLSAMLLGITGAAAYAIANIQSTVFGETLSLDVLSCAAVVFSAVVACLSMQCALAAWTGAGKGAIAHQCAVAASGFTLVLLFAWYNVIWFRY